MATCLNCGKEYHRPIGDLGSYCPACNESFKADETVVEELSPGTSGIGATSQPKSAPILTVLLILANAFVFAAMVRGGESFGGGRPGDVALQLRWGAQFGFLFASGDWWRLFTAMFLHASASHLAANMISLWFIGKQLEPVGRLRFILIYVLSGAAGSLASVLWNPMAVSVGASGAIFGLVGALLSPRRVNTRNLGSLALFVIIMVLPGAMKDHIDYMGHLGGILAGLVMGLGLHRPQQSSATTSTWRFATASAGVALALFAGSTAGKSHYSYLADFAQGNALQEKGDRDGAVTSYQRALALNPKFPEALANLGSALASKGEIGEAIDAYRKALKLKPDNGQIHLSLGLALRRNGDEAAANWEFQEAQRLDPKLKPAPRRGTLPIADNFTRACGWPGGEMESFSYGCEQGAYRMRLKKPGPVHVTRDFSLQARAVSAEVDAGVDSGSGTEPGRALLGLGCLTDENHGYVAMLKTDGTWSIFRLGPAFTPLAGENKAGGIQQLRQTNRLHVVCDGRGEKATLISFYVNGRKVGSAEDEQGYRWFNGFVLYADTFPGVVTFGHFFAGQPTE